MEFLFWLKIQIAGTELQKGLYLQCCRSLCKVMTASLLEINVEMAEKYTKEKS